MRNPRAAALILACCLLFSGQVICQDRPPAGAVRKIGVLFFDSPQERAQMLDALREGLRARGYVEERNMRLDVRYAQGDERRLETDAAELAAAVDLIVSAGTVPTGAAFRATQTVPIVMVGVGDPVARGFVRSLESPGGNVTGSSDSIPEANALRLAAIREALPRAHRVAFVANSQFTLRAPIDTAARPLGLAVTHLEARVARDFDAACVRLAAAPPDAVVVVPNPASYAARQRIAACALERKIPVMFGWREFMDAPGLMAIGAHLSELYRAAAEPIDRILKGEAPGDIPVAAAKMQLVVNSQTAKLLGLTLPPKLLERADAVVAR